MKKKRAMVCQICGLKKKASEMIPAELIYQPLENSIKKAHPEWSRDGYICVSDLNHFRAEYVKGFLEKEKGELTELEERVMKSLEEQELLSKNINVEFEQKLTYGERLSDSLTEFGGSWRFILIFAIILVLWIAMNSAVLLIKPFDPYPFIFLNLVLSCLAALQAPIIIMSQKRLEAKDRLRSEHDYIINLKAELEIRHLHEKVDHLLLNQWQRLLEIQKMQMELLEELNSKI
jgi:uncharacterized membrane protein